MSADTSPAAVDDAAHLLYDLDESQRQAVTSAARPLAILAPAGSGKTRVLTRRIAWRIATEDAEASHVLALTFTRKAAGEMRDRLRRLGLRDGVAAGTFHSIAYAQLRTWWADNNHRAPELLVRKANVLGQVLRGQADGLTAVALATEIEWAKARLLGPDRYAEGAATARRRTPVAPDKVAGHYARYEEHKRQHGLVDFDDLLKLCSDALRSDPTFAAAQRWRFRHLFVDEFQDVNPLQLDLLDAWRGDHLDLTVVGDPQQAIYGWNGADAGFLERFQERHPSAEVVHLGRNYRSTPQVLAAAASVLEAAKLDPTPVRATQAEGHPPRLTRYPTDLDEARGIARALRDHRAPRTAWSDQAVLVRTHAQIGLITEGLRAVGIPHQVKGGDTLLKRPATKATLDLLRHTRPLSSCLPDLDAEDEDGVVAELARDHLRLDPQATAAGFRAWLIATLTAEGHDRRHDVVTIATFHAAKGLEWPVVHLAGLEDGFVPVTYARTIAQRAEEARLLYVAMTRAVRDLHCSWAAQRSFNGKVIDRRVTPWLGALASVDADADPVTGPGSPTSVQPPGWQDHIAQQRALLRQARPPADPVLDALHAWREQAARAARVSPAAVLDDRSLAAVAAARPADQEELAAIAGVGRVLATSRVGDSLLAALHDANDRSA